MVLALRGGDVRAAKQAIADALRATLAYEHVPASQVHAVERATLPNLPSVEVIGLTSSPQEIGPLIRHELSIELTVSAATEDGADEQLDSLVTAVRRRLLAASRQDEVIPMGDDAIALVTLGETRWSTSAASGAAGVIRASAIGVTVEADE